MKICIAAAAALLVGCSSPPSPEVPKFEKAYKACQDFKEHWTCELRDEGLHINFEGYEAIWAISVPFILGPLELPDEILLRLKSYRPIDGMQEWKYRDVTMLFNYNRYGGSVKEASSDMLLILN